MACNHKNPVRHVPMLKNEKKKLPGVLGEFYSRRYRLMGLTGLTNLTGFAGLIGWRLLGNCPCCDLLLPETGYFLR